MARPSDTEFVSDVTPALPTLNQALARRSDYAEEVAALRVPLTQRGAADGVATLDSTSRVPLVQLRSALPDVFNAGTQTLSGTLTVDVTGTAAMILGGTLGGNLVVNLTGTFAWGASVEFRFGQAASGGPFSLTFQRNGSSAAPGVRWGGSAPSPVLSITASAIERFVALASPSGNVEITKAPGPYA
jgi:hypothetical protein